MSTTATPFSRKAALDSFERMAKRQRAAIARKIRQLRDAKGWTQQQLAAEIPSPEVDAQYVSKWERAVYMPDKHLCALAAALDSTEAAILAGAQEDENGDGARAGDLDQLDGRGDDVSELREELHALREEMVLLRADVVELGVDFAQDEAQGRKWKRRGRGSGS